MEISTYKYQKIHKFLIKNFGKAYKCEDFNCKGKSNSFDYALVKGFEYDFDRNNFMMLCRSCHSKYDEKKDTVDKKSRSLLGRKHTIKTRLLMREIAIKNKRKPPPKNKEQVDSLKKRMLGNNHGFKKGMTPWNKGKPHLQGVNHPMYGKTHTLETIKKLKESHRGQIPWNKGVPMSMESKLKLSNSQKLRLSKIKN